jgi:uncharacterized protein (TIGR03437 family)
VGFGPREVLALPFIMLKPLATAVGLDAEVQFAGGAPGLPRGVLQANVVIPVGARLGSVPIVVNISDGVK